VARELLCPPTAPAELRRLYAYVRYLVNILTDPRSITVWLRTSVVPSVLCRFSFLEPRPAGVTEQLSLLAVVLVEFEFEF